MAPLLHAQGLLPPPFVSPPSTSTLLDDLELDPTLATLALKHHAASPDIPTFHHPQTNQAIHTPKTHHAKNPSHYPLNLLLLPLFILGLLATIYFLFSWTHGHEEEVEEDFTDLSNPSSVYQATRRPGYAQKPSSTDKPSQPNRPAYTRQSSYTLTEGVRPESVSDWSSLYSDEDEKKEGKVKLTGKELNERSRLMDKHNGPTTYVFEEEWEVERYCRMKGYGGCSVERRALWGGLQEAGLLVVMNG